MIFGKIYQGKIIDINDKHYYAQVDGVTYELVGLDQDQTFKLGQEVEGMVYENKTGKKVMQVDLPMIRPGIYGWGQVTGVRKDLGLFVDVGLENKDVVLSLDDLSQDRKFWPKTGDRLYVTYEADTKNRLWAKFASKEAIANLFRPAPARLMNQEIEVTIVQLKLDGYIGLSKESYRVFIHNQEALDSLRLGQVLKVRVTHVAKDGSLNASSKPRAHQAIGDDAQMILAILSKSPQKFLALHDKSAPEDIESQLGISKGQFKRAIGNLLKNGHIQIEKNVGIRLND